MMNWRLIGEYDLHPGYSFADFIKSDHLGFTVIFSPKCSLPGERKKSSEVCTIA